MERNQETVPLVSSHLPAQHHQTRAAKEFRSHLPEKLGYWNNRRGMERTKKILYTSCIQSLKMQKLRIIMTQHLYKYYQKYLDVRLSYERLFINKLDDGACIMKNKFDDEEHRHTRCENFKG